MNPEPKRDSLGWCDDCRPRFELPPAGRPLGEGTWFLPPEAFECCLKLEKPGRHPHRPALPAPPAEEPEPFTEEELEELSEAGFPI